MRESNHVLRYAIAVAIAVGILIVPIPGHETRNYFDRAVACDCRGAGQLRHNAKTGARTFQRHGAAWLDGSLGLHGSRAPRCPRRERCGRRKDAKRGYRTVVGIAGSCGEHAPAGMQSRSARGRASRGLLLDNGDRALSDAKCSPLAQCGHVFAFPCYKVSELV